MSHSEDNARRVLRRSMELNGDLTKGGPNMDIKPPEGAVAMMRMVDFRIPLPWLLGGFLAGVMVLVGMYYQLQNVSEALRDVQITLKANQSTVIQLASEQALLKYRIEKLEGQAK